MSDPNRAGSPNGRRKPDGHPCPAFAGTVTALAQLAGTPHPDAKLLAACDRMGELLDQRDALDSRQGPGAAEGCRAFRRTHSAELDRLYATVTATRAETPTGRQAKAILALRHLPIKGWFWTFVASALQDAASAVDGGQP